MNAQALARPDVGLSWLDAVLSLIDIHQGLGRRRGWLCHASDDRFEAVTDGALLLWRPNTNPGTARGDAVPFAGVIEAADRVLDGRAGPQVRVTLPPLARPLEVRWTRCPTCSDISLMGDKCVDCRGAKRIAVWVRPGGERVDLPDEVELEVQGFGPVFFGEHYVRLLAALGIRELRSSGDPRTDMWCGSSGVCRAATMTLAGPIARAWAPRNGVVR